MPHLHFVFNSYSLPIRICNSRISGSATASAASSASVSASPLRSPCGYASCRCCCPAGILFSLLGRKWQLRQVESVAEQCHSNKADAVGQQAVEDDATNTPAIYLPPPLLALISSKFDFHFNFQLKTSFAFVLRHYPI